MTCLALLRVIPGKRQVYDALWNNREVIVKVFSHKISAKRHLKREWQGLSLLQKQCLSAPTPLFFGKTENDGLAIVVEKIVDSSTVLDAFNETISLADRLNLPGLVCEELAKQHRNGVLRKDLHLGNFLLQKGNLFAIDTAQIVWYFDKFVIIYSTNKDTNTARTAPHVKHRKFTEWVKENLPGWQLVEHIPNKYLFTGDIKDGPCSDFFIYERYR